MNRLGVIIVSYNVRDLLRNCLRSVFASAAHSVEWLHVDVTVVDNASHDGSAAMVAAEFPHVKLMASEKNLGFTGGNNLALQELRIADGELRRADGEGQIARGELRGATPAPIPSPQSPVPNPPPPDFVLLLNPDTEIVDDALGRMVNCLLERPRAGACGAQLRYGSGQFQHGAFRFPSLAQVAMDVLPLAEVPGVRRFLPRLLDSGLNGRYAQSLWQETQPFAVDFVLGAALMVRVEAIRQVGVLDDGYFMYCEEMDWCLRLQQAGWTVYAVPSASVIHYEGQSSKQVPWVTVERLWRSRFRFYHKHKSLYPHGYVLAVRALVQVGLSTRGWLARRRFARGEISGTALGDELSTYQQISKQG